MTRPAEEPSGIARAIKVFEEVAPASAVEAVAVICGVRGSTVYGWLKEGKMKGAREAVLLARALMALGKPLSIDELDGVGEDEGGPTWPTRGGVAGTGPARARRRSALS